MQKAQKFFLTLTGFLQNHKITAIFALACLFLVSADLAHAQLSEISSLDPAEMLMLLLAWILQAIAWAVGKLIVLVIGMIVIPILGYNNFGDSNIVSLGWPLVRDVVNMFVIFILLIIAIKTMLGMSKVPVSQQLVRLFLAVVAVNFSRLITLLFIDLGQVIMFTFVNALRDIAAGNFVNLFQISGFMGLDSDSLRAAVSQGGLQALGFLGSSYITLSLMFFVLGILLLMAVIFIYRIVMLWVLIIISPLAFFMAGTKDILKAPGNSYADWWGKLIGAITLGPILTFFLWLGLAAAASGPIAETEGFPATPPSDSVGLYNEIYQMEKITSLFIAIVLISIGFQAASSAAAAMEGPAARFITKEQGRAGMKMALAAPGVMGARAGRFAGRQIERRTGAFSTVGRELTSAGGALRSQYGSLAAPVAWGLQRAGGGIERTAQESTRLQKEASKKRVDNMTPNEKAQYMRSMDDRRRRGIALSQAEMDDYEQLAINYMDKGNRREIDAAFRSSMGREAGDEMIARVRGQALSELHRDETDLTPEQRKTRERFEVANLHHLRNTMEPAEFEERLQDIIVDNDELKFSDFTAESAVLPEVREALARRSEQSRRDKDGNWVARNSLDRMTDGEGGVKEEVKRALQGAGARFGEEISTSVVAGDPASGPATPEVIERRVQAQADRYQAAFSHSNPETSNSAALAAAREAEREAADARVAAGRPRDEYDLQQNDNHLEARNIDPTIHMVEPVQAEALVLGAARAGADFSEINPAARVEVIAEAGRIAGDADRTVADRRAAQRLAFSAEEANETIGTPATTDNRRKLGHLGIDVSGTINANMQSTVREEFKQRPENLSYLLGQFANTPVSTDATRAAVESVGQKELDQLVRRHAKETNAVMRDQIERAVEAVRQASRAERMTPGISTSERRRAEAAERRARLAAQQMSI